MRDRLVAALGIAVWLAGVAGAQAREPYQAMRALGAAQTRVATGQATSETQAAQLREIAEDFRGQPPAVWDAAPNRQALVTFLFSGGNAASVRAIIAQMPAGADKTLADGARANAEGRQAAARDLLLPLEARSLPGDVGGHLALVQGSLLAATDPAAARARFDLARLLMPGSLVEEAALRRAMFLLSARGADAAAFVDIARRYRARYAASAYAGNFERRLTETLVAHWPHAAPAARGLLAGVIEAMPSSTRAATWAAIARRALQETSPSIAREATAHIDADDTVDTGVRRTIALCEAISDLFVGRSGVAGAGQRLRQMLDAAAPGDRDRDLLRAAIMIADNIAAPMPAAPASGPASPDAPVEATIVRAQALLAGSPPGSPP